MQFQPCEYKADWEVYGTEIQKLIQQLALGSELSE